MTTRVQILHLSARLAVLVIARKDGRTEYHTLRKVST